MSGPAEEGRGGERRRHGALGLPRLHYRTVPSTNERAKELAGLGAPHGTLVTADEQTRGRGRQGRRWQAPPGRALLASVVLRDLDERDALLPLAVAVAVCEACEAVASVDCRIKWPNDVLIDGRKAGGVLVEGRPEEGWAVVGVGVNVTTAAGEFAPELRQTATSLALASRGATPAPGPTVAGLLTRLLDSLGGVLEAGPDGVLAAWRGRDALAGRPVRWERGAGTAVGVDDNGGLVVETPEGRMTLDAGEVHLG